MCELTGRTQIFSGDTDDVDTVQKFPLGFRAWDTSNNKEFIYCRGVGSTAAGDWVSIDEENYTLRLVADAVGRVGIAMAAIDSTSEYGWYQIYGKNTIAHAATTVVADTPAYIDGTTAYVDDDGVAGDWICGAWIRSTATDNVITAELNYPGVHDDGYLT